MHTLPDQKVYIGATCQIPQHRWKCDGNGYKRHSKFYEAIRECGWDNIKHDILFENLSKAEAQLKEIELIGQYKSQDSQYGYNVYEGGSFTKTGIVPSQATRQKIKNALYGRNVSEQTRLKIAKSSRGRVHSDEVRKKLSVALTGRKISLESSQKSAIGHWKSVVQLSKDGEIIKIWGSIKDASETLGINHNGIGACCRKAYGRKIAGGYKWEYAPKVRPIGNNNEINQKM